MNYSQKNDPHNGGYTHYRFDCALYVAGKGWTPLCTTGSEFLAEDLLKGYLAKHPGSQMVIDDVKQGKFIYVPALHEGHTTYPFPNRTEHISFVKEEAARIEATVPAKHHRGDKVIEAKAEILPPDTSSQDLAKALYSQISDKPLTARKVSEKAGADYDGDPRVKKILKKLRDAGKIVCIEGRWTRMKAGKA